MQLNQFQSRSLGIRFQIIWQTKGVDCIAVDHIIQVLVIHSLVGNYEQAGAGGGRETGNEANNRFESERNEGEDVELTRRHNPLD